MDEKEAKKILKGMGSGCRFGDEDRDNKRLDCVVPYVDTWPDEEDKDVILDGEFTIEQLKAIVWWLENKR